MRYDLTTDFINRASSGFIVTQFPRRGLVAAFQTNGCPDLILDEQQILAVTRGLPGRQKSLAAAPLSTLKKAARHLSPGNEAFNRLFRETRIPHPVTGEADSLSSYSGVERDIILSMAQELAYEIASDRPVNMYVDIDGTLARLNRHPGKVRVEKEAYRGLVRLSQFPNVSIAAITGRGAMEASALLTPGHEVRNSKNKILCKNGTRKLHFSVIGSYGVEKMNRDESLDRYDFGPDATRFIQFVQQESGSLAARYPGIRVENGKHGAVGINVAGIANAAHRKQAREAALDILRRFENAPENPIHPVYGHKTFHIKYESEREMEFRAAGYGKDFGLKTFGNPDRAALTWFLCDSNEGIDKPMIEAANRDFKRGRVALVRNGRNSIPDASALNRAHIALANPTMMGRFLYLAVTMAEAALDCRTKPSDMQPAIG